MLDILTNYFLDSWIIANYNDDSILQEKNMMVSVRGQNDRLSKKEIRKSVSLFGNILLGKRLSDNIYVEVYNESYDLNDMGFCNPMDFEERSPREFEIFVNKNLCKYEQLLTIAHEMVHIKQFALNEFKVFDNHEYKWRGKKVRHPRKKHSNLPWEKEAIASEPWLMHFYEKHCENNNLVWK